MLAGLSDTIKAPATVHSVVEFCIKRVIQPTKVKAPSAKLN